MTVKQAMAYNKMLACLRRIAKSYQTPQQLLKCSEKEYGLDFKEALEMSYENIQEDAKRNSKGLSPIKF